MNHCKTVLWDITCRLHIQQFKVIWSPERDVSGCSGVKVFVRMSSCLSASFFLSCSCTDAASSGSVWCCSSAPRTTDTFVLTPSTRSTEWRGRQSPPCVRRKLWIPSKCWRSLCFQRTTCLPGNDHEPYKPCTVTQVLLILFQHREELRMSFKEPEERRSNQILTFKLAASPCIFLIFS